MPSGDAQLVNVVLQVRHSSLTEDALVDAYKNSFENFEKLRNAKDVDNKVIETQRALLVTLKTFLTEKGILNQKEQDPLQSPEVSPVQVNNRLIKEEIATVENDSAKKFQDWAEVFKKQRPRVQSKLREIEILQFIDDKNTLVGLDDILNYLVRINMASESDKAAITTQIYRIKEKGYLSSKFPGFYEITTDGEEYLPKVNGLYEKIAFPNSLRAGLIKEYS